MMASVSEPGFYGGKYLRAGENLPEGEPSEKANLKGKGGKKLKQAAGDKPNQGFSSE